MINNKPFKDRLILKLDSKEDQKVGLIVVANKHQEEPTMGTVVGLPEYEILPDGTPVFDHRFSYGDRVKIGKSVGTQFTGDDGDKYHVIRVDDILIHWKEES
ncbi:hypothetical protein A134_23125 [Vibrio crassostreae 9CS106]|uniref:10 kDa chaperonin n=1 Tax=Vibrio crassostreae 9CS106 TaxID=1191300 RepID=A0A1B1C3K3_9VIBR|nr:hypothetical protein A134_23125 [Vibrio crassostreae 9CS106]